MGGIIDVAAGIWLWRSTHPEWSPSWDRLSNSVCAHARGEVIVVDPLAPGPDNDVVWSRLDEDPPSIVVILSPLHLRDVDLFVTRYGARAFGPRFFLRNDIPDVELEPIEAGSALPGGASTVYDGRDRHETPLWLPDHRTLVFADDVRGTPNGLRIWDVPWYEQRTLPAMRRLLRLPFETVLTAHGEPVHDRAAFEHALTQPPSSNAEQAALSRREPDN
jgi:glyoxylase-like metal-dependent hydrolase (beta-lactamase superfamily II)